MTTLAQALKSNSETLVGVSDTPYLDAQTLLANAFGKSRAWIFTHPEEYLPDTIQDTLKIEVEKLINGIPLPYVLGHWEFYGLDFTLTQDTLIPRPETELLVEQALNWFDRRPERRHAADIGTGSGCIAVTLANLNSKIDVIATDISYPALRVARNNSSRYNVANRIHLLQADLATPIARRSDLICANLPYIPTQTLSSLKVAQGEPNLALDGGANGLDLISSFLELAPHQIAPGGILLIEIESSQGSQVEGLAHKAFPTAKISLKSDLSGHDRLFMIQLPEDN